MGVLPLLYSSMEQEEIEQPLKIPGPCPFFTRPTLVNCKVRDLSLTDFRGKFLFVFFYKEDFKYGEDVKELAKKQKCFKQSDCEALACSTESSLEIPLMSDRLGELSRKLDIYDEEEGVCLRSFLIVDEKGIMRHLAATSLPIEDLIKSSLDTI